MLTQLPSVARAMPVASGQYVSEDERLEQVKRLCSFDSPPIPLLDRIVAGIAEVTDCPIALVSVIGARRQWFAAQHGLRISQMRRAISFCTHTIRYSGSFEVRDASLDRRFKSNPLVLGKPGVRYYAGVPLVTANGARIGALCVIDIKSRTAMNEERWRCFRSGARAIVSAMECGTMAV